MLGRQRGVGNVSAVALVLQEARRRNALFDNPRGVSELRRRRHLHDGRIVRHDFRQGGERALGDATGGNRKAGVKEISSRDHDGDLKV